MDGKEVLKVNAILSFKSYVQICSQIQLNNKILKIKINITMDTPARLLCSRSHQILSLELFFHLCSPSNVHMYFLAVYHLSSFLCYRPLFQKRNLCPHRSKMLPCILLLTVSQFNLKPPQTIKLLHSRINYNH